MRDTAASTAPAERLRTAQIAWVVVVLTLAGTAVACGDETGGAQAPYAVGEGAALADGYENAFAVNGGEAVLGRPTSPVEAWGGGCRQLFAGGRSGTAALLQESCGLDEQVFAVSDDFWTLYQAAGQQASTRYGFPVGHRGEWGGGWTQGFGRRGGFEHFFMQRPGRPVHVLSSPILDHYLSYDDRDVRIGFPVSGQASTSDGRRCQEFEHAAITVEGVGYRAVSELVPLLRSARTSTCG